MQWLAPGSRKEDLRQSEHRTRRISTDGGRLVGVLKWDEEHDAIEMLRRGGPALAGRLQHGSIRRAGALVK